MCDGRACFPTVARENAEGRVTPVSLDRDSFSLTPRVRLLHRQVLAVFEGLLCAVNLCDNVISVLLSHRQELCPSAEGSRNHSVDVHEQRLPAVESNFRGTSAATVRSSSTVAKTKASVLQMSGATRNHYFERSPMALQSEACRAIFVVTQKTRRSFFRARRGRTVSIWVETKTHVFKIG